MVQVFIGAALLAVVIVMSILLICGLPLGEFSMGGRFGKVWPPKIRIIGISQLLTQIFALYRPLIYRILYRGSGAVEVLLTHNPNVGGSKPPLSIIFIIIYFYISYCFLKIFEGYLILNNILIF